LCKCPAPREHHVPARVTVKSTITFCSPQRLVCTFALPELLKNEVTTNSTPARESCIQIRVYDYRLLNPAYAFGFVTCQSVADSTTFPPWVIRAACGTTSRSRGIEVDTSPLEHLVNSHSQSSTRLQRCYAFAILVLP
jgi:hypothetical protein